MKDEVIVLTVYDHSKLGGPMDSERPELLAIRLFSTENKALKWALRMAKTYDYTLPEWSRQGMSNRQLKEALSDIGPVGFEFKKMKVG